MKSGWIIFAGSLLVVGVAASWWLSERNSSMVQAPRPTPKPVAETIVDTLEPMLPETDSGLQTGEASTESFARRLKRVPNARPAREENKAGAELRDMTADNIEQLLQANLEQALDGELVSAYFVVRARMACERFSSTREELEQRIERINKRVERDVERGREVSTRRGNELSLSFSGDTDANRSQMERWYDSCQQVRNMMSTDLRQQLESRALSGDVMARYLYASWPLEALNAGEAFDQQYRWEGLARDFSQANLDVGEVAGLMAFAQSYMNGWFTKRDNDLALAFSVAALNCGFETGSSRNFLTNRIERLTNSDDPVDMQRLQFALAEADHLGWFCIN